MAEPSPLSVDLDGAYVLLTGGTSGIGLDAAERLLEAGAVVDVVGRRKAKGEHAARELRKRTGGAASFLQTDLSSLDEVRRLAKRVRDRAPDGVDVVVNNAGTLAHHREPTEDGLDETFAVNTVAPFLLTHLLQDDLDAASGPLGEGARVVNVASAAHYGADTFDLDVMQDPKRSSIRRAYNRSKLAMVAWSLTMAHRWEEAGVDVNALHPGFIPGTALFDSLPLGLGYLVRLAAWLPGAGRRSTAEGGWAIAHLAASPDVEPRTGGYLHGPAERTPSDAARDRAWREALWTRLEEITGV